MAQPSSVSLGTFSEVQLRSTKNVYERIVAADNVRAAVRDACSGKRRRPAVASFLLREEEETNAIQVALVAGTWRPRGYRTIIISEPKLRLIAAAPFGDRVVHHAIHRVIEPLLSARFIHDSFACREGRGTHRAVLRFQEGLRAHPWVGRLDVRRYFLEIEWDILLAIIARKIRDHRCMELLEHVLASGAALYEAPEVLDVLGLRGKYLPRPRKGLPIGNLTSQLFANVYLDGLDHFAKRDLKIPLYLRYMDDVVVFGATRGKVEAWRREMSAWLKEKRRLEVHPDHGQAQSSRGTFRFLGYVVSREERRVAGRAVRRMRAKLRAELDSGIPDERLDEVAERTRALVRSWVV